MNILFICTGNTCRSPMAEAILKHKGIDNLSVKSAGIFAANGSKATPHTIKVLEENSIQQQHTSKMLTEEELKWATYIFTMTSSHKETIVQHYPFAIEKTFTLKEFVNGSGTTKDVVDPYGGNEEIYRKTYSELSSLINELIKKL